MDPRCVPPATSRLSMVTLTFFSFLPSSSKNLPALVLLVSQSLFAAPSLRLDPNILDLSSTAAALHPVSRPSLTLRLKTLHQRRLRSSLVCLYASRGPYRIIAAEPVRQLLRDETHSLVPASMAGTGLSRERTFQTSTPRRSPLRRNQNCAARRILSQP